MKTFKEFISEDASITLDKVKYDNSKGWGAVPYNKDIDYFGLQLVTTPKKFLEMAAMLNREDAASTDAIKAHIESGGGIGTPFLDVEFEDNDGNAAPIPWIKGHEGRNRAYAIMELHGADTEMLVHILPRGGLRKRHITDEMKEALMKHVYAEKSTTKVISKPFIREE